MHSGAACMQVSSEQLAFSVAARSVRQYKKQQQQQQQQQRNTVNMQVISAATPTTSADLSKRGGRLLSTLPFAMHDMLLLNAAATTAAATTPPPFCQHAPAADYVVVEAMRAVRICNKQPSSTKAGRGARDCKKRNNSGRSKCGKLNKNNSNSNSSSNSSSYALASHNSQHRNVCAASTAIAATAATTAASCSTGESRKLSLQAQRPKAAQTVAMTGAIFATTTPARKISHRKNKRSSNNSNNNTNKHNGTTAMAATTTTTTATATATTATAATAAMAAAHTTVHSRTAAVATTTTTATASRANLIVSPLVMLLQFMQLLRNTTTTATTTATTTPAIKATSAAARCQAAAMQASACTTTRTRFRLLPGLGATSFFTLLTLVCLETVLLSTVSNCAKTFYMHWNTSNSIFRIDNTDHIIDVNKGNLAFEFDQVHIICPVYEPGTFENETEKYIIYNVSKVEYETCRITNADPRVIAICDKPQKLMFFTITFRPFTPQPGGLEFLPGNDYYFISTSSKDDLYRRIGGRCSTNNMKVVFKVCCAPEEKNKTTSNVVGGGSSSGTTLGAGSPTGSSTSNNAAGAGTDNGVGGAAGGMDMGNVDVLNAPTHIGQHPHMNNINTIGINGVNTGLMPIGGNGGGVGVGGGGGIQLKPLNGVGGTSINTNVDQFNRIPIQTNGVNVMGNNIGGMGLGNHGGSGIMLTPGGGGGIGGGVAHGGINLIPNGGMGQYPGQTGIRINNVASQQHHPTHKINNNHNNNNNNHNDDHYDKHPNEVVKNEELTYNSGAAATLPHWLRWGANSWTTTTSTVGWLLASSNSLYVDCWQTVADAACRTLLHGICRTRQRTAHSSRNEAWRMRQQQVEQRAILNSHKHETNATHSIVDFKYLIFSYYKAILATIALMLFAMKCICKRTLQANTRAMHAAASAAHNVDAAVAVLLQSQPVTTDTPRMPATATATTAAAIASNALSSLAAMKRQNTQCLDLMESEDSSYLLVNYRHNSKSTKNYSVNVENFR